MNYAFVFYVPAVVIALCWTVILLRSRSEWKQVLLWAAMLFNAAAALAAVWAMAHRPALRARSYIDFRYEIGALFVSLMGFAFGLLWSLRPKQRLCWVPTLSSCWLAILWFVIMTTG